MLIKNTTLPTNSSTVAKKILTEEGWRGLILPGMAASLLREVSYSSIRFGLYKPVKGLITPENGTAHLGHKILSGMVTGALGSALANPTDVVKIRLQVATGKIDPATGLYMTGMRKGSPPAYKNTFNAFAVIWKEEGWNGVSATVFRAALLTGGQLSSYDHSKTVLKDKWGYKEGTLLHVTCSLISSFTAATVSAPADLIKTRVMGEHVLSDIRDDFEPTQKRIRDCIMKTLKTDGLIGFYKGWGPSFMRLSIHFVIALPVYEQIRLLLGLGHF